MTAQFSLDTNCLLRWLLNDVPEQASLVANVLKSGQLFHIADQAIIEMFYVLEKIYELPRSAIADLLNVLLANGALQINRELFSELAKYYVGHPSLSATDCYLTLEALQAAATPLLTFDKQLAKKLVGAQLLVNSSATIS